MARETLADFLMRKDADFTRYTTSTLTQLEKGIVKDQTMKEKVQIELTARLFNAHALSGPIPD